MDGEHHRGACPFDESPLWIERTGVKVQSSSAGDLSSDMVSMVAQRPELDLFLRNDKYLV